MSLIYIPKRYIVAVFTSFGLLLLTATQTNFSMTNTLILIKDNRLKTNESDPSRINDELKDVDWSPVDLSFLNSIFYIGYLISNFPSGFLVQRYSSTKMFVYPLIIVFVLNLFLPWSIGFRSSLFSGRMNYYLVGFIRLIQGICGGSAFPASHGILSKWCPTSERGRIGSFIYTGLYAGPILGFSLGGFLVDSLGHDSVYFVSANIGLVWSLIYWTIIYEYPGEHPRISKEELMNIEQNSLNLKSLDENKCKEGIPWRSILTSLPVWSICFAHFARGWTFSFLLTNQPTFLRAYGFDMKQIGFFGSIPYLLKVSLAISSGFIADFLRLHCSWSTTNIRKLMTCSGYYIQGTCLFILSFVIDQTLIIVLLTIGVGFSGLMVSGWHLNYQDLSTRYSSILAGLTSIFGTSASILSPIVAGFLTKEKDFNGWRHVFIVICLVLFICSTFYLIFSSGQIQSWSNGQPIEQRIRLNSDRLPPLLNSVQQQVQHETLPSSSNNRFYSSISAK